MGEFARALGTEEEITVEGKVYKKAAMIMDVIAEFELFLEDQAFDALKRQERRLPPAEYDKRFIALTHEVAAGSCGFLSDLGQSVYRNSATDPKNKAGIELLYLRLKHGNPGSQEITREFAAKYIEGNFEKAMEALARELAIDPNSQGPPAATGGEDSESKPLSPGSQENPSA
jgi:hypothetical protein